MRHLDFTIDFETVGLTANAAPMMVAIVPWLRDNREDPFAKDEDGMLTEEQASKWPEPLELYVDLRSCVVEGYDFDPETIAWWTKQSYDAKRAVCDGLAQPVGDVTVEIVDYLRRRVEQLQLDSICLWSQGDTDMGILRNLCKRNGYDMEEDVIAHTQLRDCRTVILEAAHLKYRKEIREANKDIRGGEKITTSMMICGKMIPCSPNKYLECPREAYKLFASLPDRYAQGSEAHDALYDALRSSWYTWQALRWLME